MPSHRRAPTILLTATVATVVILPWAVDSAPGGSVAQSPPDGAIRLSQQPLPALGAGRTVREVTQDEPFSMVALTGADLTGASARVRARLADGSWGPWYPVAHEDQQAAHSGPRSGPDGTEPVFVGTTTAVQIAVTRPAGAKAEPAPSQPPPIGGPAKPALGYRPATAEHPFPQHISAVLIAPPRAPVDAQWTPPAAVTAPGQPPNVIPRSLWGAGETNRCKRPAGGSPVRAAVVHHTAGSNDYSPHDSAEIVRAIHAYHTRTLGWCDIGYNALVDKYGQVFEGRAGGITRQVEGAHAGGFNRNTWGVSMIGSFDDEPPPSIQLRAVGQLLGWRLSLDGADPLGAAELASAGGSFTFIPRGATLTLPTIFGHRDVDATECPGVAGYAALDEIRAIAERFSQPPGPEDVIGALEGGAILARWLELGGPDSVLGLPTSPESAGEGSARYATFERGAMYWSPETGAQPVTGAIHEAWASLGYEWGVLGLPTSAEIQEPEWVGQNFVHGTLNYDRASGMVTQVVDGIAEEVPAAGEDGPPVQLERFSPIENPAEQPDRPTD